MRLFKRASALITALLLIFSLSACERGEREVDVAAIDANEYLTDFFSDYSEVNKYLKDPDIAISAFALDGAGLSSLLRALYQSQSVTFAFSLPLEIEEDVFTSNVTVVSPNMSELKLMYDIDREISILSEEGLSEDYVAQMFFANIRDGAANFITRTIPVTVRYANGTWSLDINNDLAFAIFPNIEYV